MNTAPHELTEDESPTKTIRTLLVDDSPLIREILAQFLARENGFTVVGTATDGRQALQYASTLLPDLILMDFHVPHLNGPQATQLIKQFVNPPIIFIVTSDDNSGSRLISKAAGADAYIVKSGDLGAQLRSKLREWFGPTADSMRQDGNQRKNP